MINPLSRDGQGLGYAYGGGYYYFGGNGDGYYPYNLIFIN